MSIKMQLDVDNLLLAVAELAKRMSALEKLIDEIRSEPRRPEIKLKNGKAYI